MLQALFAIAVGMNFLTAQESTPSRLCNLYPDQFTVTEAGRVTLRNSGGGFERSGRNITFSNVSPLSSGYSLRSLRLDDRDRAEHLEVSASVIGGNPALRFAMMAATTVNEKYTYGYRNDRCFVREVHVNGRMVANAELCHSLKSLLDSCGAGGCGEPSVNRITALLQQYQINLQSEEFQRSARSARGTPTAVVAARSLSETCNRNRHIKAALDDAQLWQQTGAPQPPAAPEANRVKE